MNYLLGLVVMVTFISGCAVEYQPPANESLSYIVPHNLSREIVIAKAKKVLIQEGFQIQAIDSVSGLISTEPKIRKMQPEQANCGKVLSLNYLYDTRTTTDLAFDVIVGKTDLTISSSIHGSFKPSAVDEAILLTCLSHGGALEQNLAYKILN